MNIYIAAPWGHREDARAASLLVEQAGHTITHKWWDHEAGDEDYDTLKVLAEKDIHGVYEADVLILLNLVKSEGKAVEQGLAIAAGIPVFGVGAHPTNIFQNLQPGPYLWFDSVEHVLGFLKEARETEQ